MSVHRLITYLCIFAFIGRANAANRYWDGGGGTSSKNWSTVANWLGPEPLSTDDASFGSIYDSSADAVITNSGETCWFLYLGYDTSTTGTIDMTSGTLNTAYQYVGYKGTGRITQTGGTDNVTYSLRFGWYSGSTGTYTLSGTGVLNVGQALSLNNPGNGIFEWYRSGGLTTPSIILGSTGSLVMGFNYSMTDLLNGSLFNGTSLTGLNLGGLAVSNGGTATHSNGTTVAVNRLSIGGSGGGTYLQSGGSNSVAANMVAGYAGYVTGTYDQSGGTNSIGGNVYLGYSNYGIGKYLQSGGTNTISSNLYLGYGFSSNGTYRLSGSGTLNVAGNLRIGADGGGTGRFEWFRSDALTAPILTVGSQGTLATGFDYAVGSLVNGSLFHGSTLNGLNTGTLEITNGSTVTHQAPTTNTVNYLNVGSDTGSGAYTQSGGSNTALKDVRLGASSDSSGTYSQTGGTTTINGTYRIGNASSSTGEHNLGGNGQLNVSWTYVGDGGQGTFNQTGGAHTMTNSLFVGRNSGSVGVYNLSDGTIDSSLEAIGFDGHGTFNQMGGYNQTITQYVGDNFGSQGFYNLFNGEMDSSSLCVGLEGSGIFTQTGGNHTTTALFVGADPNSSGEYRLIEGTLNLKYLPGAPQLYIGYDASGTFKMGNDNSTGVLQESGTGTGADLYVRYRSGATGTLQGWGAVELKGDMVNNGRIIADGYGTNRDLVMSSFATLANTIENTGTNGWFARGKGRLVLPDIMVQGSDSVCNWGESPYGTGTGQDPQIDLVNSVQLAIHGITVGGKLSGALLATDRSDINLPLSGTFIGLWNFNAPTLSFNSTTLTFRYDDALASNLGLTQNDLKVYQYNGTIWVDVTGSLDTTNKCITTQDRTFLSSFAVGVIPITATLAGTLDLRNYSGDKQVSANVELRQGGSTLRTDHVTLDATGGFILSGVTPGVYDVWVKASHWLAKTTSGVTISDDTNIGIVTTINGDCDGDNEITSTDFSAVLVAMDAQQGAVGFDPQADLDGDGEITDQDLSILVTGLDCLGDP